MLAYAPPYDWDAMAISAKPRETVFDVTGARTGSAAHGASRYSRPVCPPREARGVASPTVDRPRSRQAQRCRTTPRGRRRADAANQRQCPPEREPTATLVGPIPDNEGSGLAACRAKIHNTDGTAQPSSLRQDKSQILVGPFMKISFFELRQSLSSFISELLEARLAKVATIGR